MAGDLLLHTARHKQHEQKTPMSWGLTACHRLAPVSIESPYTVVSEVLIAITVKSANFWDGPRHSLDGLSSISHRDGPVSIPGQDIRDL
jgi:hypothetical protein